MFLVEWYSETNCLPSWSRGAHGHLLARFDPIIDLENLFFKTYIQYLLLNTGTDRSKFYYWAVILDQEQICCLLVSEHFAPSTDVVVEHYLNEKRSNFENTTKYRKKMKLEVKISTQIPSDNE